MIPAREALQTPCTHSLWKGGAVFGAPEVTLPHILSQGGLVSLAPRNSDLEAENPRLGKLSSLSRPRFPSPSTVRGRLFSSMRSPSAAPPPTPPAEAASWSARVQGLGAHRAFPSETSVPHGPARAGTRSGGRCPAQPPPNGSLRRVVGVAWRRTSAPARACVGATGRGSRAAPPRPGVSARPISQPPQRGADAACGAGYPECSARGQLTGVWFSRRRQQRRRLRWLLLLLWWRWRPGPEPRLPSPPPRAPPPPPAPRGT